MHESKSSGALYLAALLPLLLMALIGSAIVSKFGTAGGIGVGAVATAFLALFLGFGLPLLAIGQVPRTRLPSVKNAARREIPSVELNTNQRTGQLAT